MTCTVTLMISRAAVRILSTLTRINTLFLTACKCDWTVWVAQTFIWKALSVRVAFVVLKAEAASSMTAGLAIGIGPTRFKDTGILTFAFGACFVVWTFQVTFATR